MKAGLLTRPASWGTWEEECQFLLATDFRLILVTSKSFSETVLPWQSSLFYRHEQLFFFLCLLLPLPQLSIVVLKTIQELNKPELSGKIDHAVDQAVSVIIHPFMCYMTCELYSDKDYIFSQTTDKSIE